ncbi:MAG: autotransporter domain-containing protein [Pseudomonadota bacterium]
MAANYSGATSVLITGASTANAVGFTVTLSSGAVTGGVGALASRDLVRANAEKFTPGLGGLADLNRVFGIPDRGVQGVVIDQDGEFPSLGQPIPIDPTPGSRACRNARERLKQLDQDIAGVEAAINRVLARDAGASNGEDPIKQTQNEIAFLKKRLEFLEEERAFIDKISPNVQRQVALEKAERKAETIQERVAIRKELAALEKQAVEFALEIQRKREKADVGGFATAASSRELEFIRQDILSKIALAERDLVDLQPVLKKLAALRDRLARLKNARDAIERRCPPTSFAAGFAQSGTAVTVSASKLAFSFDAGSSGADIDPRLNYWINGSVIFHDDGRRGVGQNGETYALAGGVSWAFRPNLTGGLVARYGRTDLSGASGTTKADTFSIGAFVQGQITDKIGYDIVGAFTQSKVDATFNQAGITTSGSPDIKSFALQSSISGQFSYQGVRVSPRFGLSYVYVDQQAFMRSDGVFVPGDISERLSIQGGANFSKTFRNRANSANVTPSFGLNAVYNLSGQQDFLLPGGSRSKAGRLGVTANAGIAIKTDGGAAFNFSASASSFEGGQNSYGLSLAVNIPLN